MRGPMRLRAIRESLEKGLPLMVSSTRDGVVTILINGTLYEYGLDAALIPGTRKSMMRNPWKSLNFIKRRARWWKKL